MKLLCAYLFLINVIGFVLMGADKRRAKTGRWRVPEASLFGTALLGGSVGSLLGMLAFRHKTRHASFVTGMPLILIAQLAAAWYLLFR